MLDTDKDVRTCVQGGETDYEYAKPLVYVLLNGIGREQPVTTARAWTTRSQVSKGWSPRMCFVCACSKIQTVC